MAAVPVVGVGNGSHTGGPVYGGGGVARLAWVAPVCEACEASIMLPGRMHDTTVVLPVGNNACGPCGHTNSCELFADVMLIQASCESTFTWVFTLSPEPKAVVIAGIEFTGQPRASLLQM